MPRKRAANPPLPTSQDEDETTLRSIVENAQHFAIYRVALDPSSPYGGRLVLASPSIRDIVGIDDHLRFEEWFAQIHPDDAQRVQNANRMAWEQGVPYNQTARFYNRHQDRWVWVHTISNPHFNTKGELTHFDGMVIDITDQVNLRETERLRRAAEGLREILRVINSNRSLQEILDFIAMQAGQLLGASATMIRHLEVDRDEVVTVASYNLPADYDVLRVLPFYRTQFDEILIDRRPYAITDIQGTFQPQLEAESPHSYTELQRLQMVADVKHFKSVLKAPVQIKETLYGGLTFYYDQPREFSEEDVRMALTVADQAALAIENARLIDQVKQTAVVEERNRLARELHDAVTQTLFSTTLIAEVLPTLLERNPAEGRRQLEELRRMTRGALAEMRTLLLELRPAALADTELCDLLRHLANAFSGRSRVPVDLRLEGSCETPLELKVALYRIAQEALNNIFKHAEAEQVVITLAVCDEAETVRKVSLTIADDGQGFNPENLPPDHLGLGIMRERAAQAGAQIEIHSRPGAGTQVRVEWGLPPIAAGSARNASVEEG